MVIYMRHERHGTKVAISELEAKADEKTGWERFDPSVRSEDPKQVSNTLHLKRPRDKG